MSAIVTETWRLDDDSEIRLQHIGGYLVWTSERLPAVYSVAVRNLQGRGYGLVET